MRDKDKNRDPERARKRAMSDLRCAVGKLVGKERKEEACAAVLAVLDRVMREGAA